MMEIGYREKPKVCQVCNEQLLDEEGNEIRKTYASGGACSKQCAGWLKFISNFGMYMSGLVAAMSGGGNPIPGLPTPVDLRQFRK